MKFRTIIYASAVVMAASCGNNTSKTEGQQAVQQEVKLSNVQVMSVAAEDIPQSDVYTSTVEPYATNNIAPQSPSRIKRIYVEVGDFVKAGQIVARMDDLSLNQSKL